MSDEALIIQPRAEQPDKRVEICRSFSYRLNIGNYQHADFFSSIKQECAAEDAEETSAAAYDFCEREVRKAIKDFSKKMAAKAERMSA